MKKILFALSALALLAACDKAPKEAPKPAPASVQATLVPETPPTDKWVGKWVGVEGLHLTIAKEPGLTTESEGTGAIKALTVKRL